MTVTEILPLRSVPTLGFGEAGFIGYGATAFFYMKSIFQYRWTIARLLVIAANIVAIISIPRERSNLDWGACFLISVIWSASLFAWLTLARNNQSMDWSDPYSWTKAFWPMIRYPLRFWILMAYTLVSAGVVTMLVDVIFHNGHEAVGGTFFFIGLFTGVAIIVWENKYGHNV